MNVLRSHIGHRAVLRDEKHLRCVDCSVVLVLSPSVLSYEPLRPVDPCPAHPGRHAASCGFCRSEALEAREPLPEPVKPSTPEGRAKARQLWKDRR